MRLSHRPTDPCYDPLWESRPQSSVLHSHPPCSMGVSAQTTSGGLSRGVSAQGGWAASSKPWSVARVWQEHLPYPSQPKLWLCYPAATLAGVSPPPRPLPRPVCYSVVGEKRKAPWGKGGSAETLARRFCAWELARPQGGGDVHPNSPSASSDGFSGVGAVTQKWTRSTS